jgi:hypothetical protein
MILEELGRRAFVMMFIVPVLRWLVTVFRGVTDGALIVVLGGLRWVSMFL